MSKFISEILAYPEREIKNAINLLEQNNGHPSNDVRQLAEHIQKTRLKISQLQLDPNDTTAPELYQALLIKFQTDSRRFDEYFGTTKSSNSQKAQKAVEIISNNLDLPDRWVLKCPVAKALLQQHPPRKLMKQLHYRSVESLIKRQVLTATYLNLARAETPAWNKTHLKLVSVLDSTAFERRKLNISTISRLESKTDQDQSSVLYNNELGAIGVLEFSENKSVSLLMIVLELLERLSEFKQLDVSEVVAQFSSTLSWWADSDGLMAMIGDQKVSFNLYDVATNHSLGQSSDTSVLGSAQKSFWRQLVNLYENQLLPDEDNLPAIFKPIGNLTLVNQPVFEYVEGV